MVPITVDGLDIKDATIDGTEVSEITVDGTVVFDAIRGSEVLDDWADDPDKNGQIDNRDTFDETPYEGPDTSDRFNPVERAVWEIDNGSPDIDGGTLTLQDGDAIRTAFDFDGNAMIWQFDLGDDDDNRSYYSLFAQSSTLRDGDKNLEDSYYIEPESGDLILDEGGSRTDLITNMSMAANDTVKVERSEDAEFEVYVNGELEDSVTDDTFESGDWTGMAAQEGQLSDEFLENNFYEIYPQ